MRGYAVNSNLRFIKCDQTVTATLDNLIEKTRMRKLMAWRSINFFWRVHQRVKAKKTEAKRIKDDKEAKELARRGFGGKKKKKGAKGYGALSR